MENGAGKYKTSKRGKEVDPASLGKNILSLATTAKNKGWKTISEAEEEALFGAQDAENNDDVEEYHDLREYDDVREYDNVGENDDGNDEIEDDLLGHLTDSDEETEEYV